MTRKSLLSTIFLGLTAVTVGWEISAAINPRDNVEPWTSLIADYVPPAIAWAAIVILCSWLPGHFAQAYAERGKAMTMQELVFVPATPTPGAPKEPLLSPGIITAIVSAALSLGVSFGLSLTPEQTGTVVGVVTLLAPLVVAWWGRRKVFAPATVRAMVVQAASSGEVATQASVQPANPDEVDPRQAPKIERPSEPPTPGGLR